MNCPTCGTELRQTTYGRKFCPNHGVVDDGDYEHKSDEEPSYIG